MHHETPPAGSHVHAHSKESSKKGLLDKLTPCSRFSPHKTDPSSWSIFFEHQNIFSEIVCPKTTSLQINPLVKIFRGRIYFSHHYLPFDMFFTIIPSGYNNFYLKFYRIFLFSPATKIEPRCFPLQGKKAPNCINSVGIRSNSIVSK